jgi:hypothetical protein
VDRAAVRVAPVALALLLGAGLAAAAVALGRLARHTASDLDVTLGLLGAVGCAAPALALVARAALLARRPPTASAATTGPAGASRVGASRVGTSRAGTSPAPSATRLGAGPVPPRRAGAGSPGWPA